MMPVCGTYLKALYGLIKYIGIDDSLGVDVIYLWRNDWWIYRYRLKCYYMAVVHISDRDQFCQCLGQVCGEMNRVCRVLTGYIIAVHMLLENLFLNAQDGDHTQTLFLLPEIELLVVSVHVCAGKETQQEWLVAYEGVANSRTAVYLYI